MQTIKGPGLFLAQYIGEQAPFNSLEGLAGWAAGLGFKALQIPCNHPHLFDLETAAHSQNYCDDVAGRLAEYGLVISELSTHLEGQLIAVHPAYNHAFNDFAPSTVRHHHTERQQWAVNALTNAAAASEKLGLRAHATFSGALARRWRPILDVFDHHGVDVCYELHPSEDLHDGISFERFLDAVDNHPRCHVLYDPSHMRLQHMDYLAFIDIYHDRIRAFHVKDAEFIPSGKSGVYGGYQPWTERAGRFRSPGDGQIDFKSIFSKLAQYDYPGWAVLEWECCLKEAETGAREGAEFIRRHIIPVAGKAFDDFAATTSDHQAIRNMLGLEGENAS
ncbi:sugar phosphate isomerase/epimerase [Dickeya dianthicola]|uniref:sugar phosphate isomerase/epimerase family protein n=1 Tax=Dickeya dianthicola TaxID=204039 RepID=UPI003016C004